MEQIRTAGWASELLYAWKEALKPNKEKQKPPPVSFYGVRKVLQPVENVTNIHSNKVMFRRLLIKSRNGQHVPTCEKSAPCFSNTVANRPLKLHGEKKKVIIDDDLVKDPKRRKKDGNSPNQYEQDLLDMYK